jgi:hypothetical protein
MPQGDEDVVVHLDVVAAEVHLGVDVGRSSEELHRLVDEVAAEIEEQPARLLWCPPLPPRSGRRRRLPALESRLEAMDRSERAFVDDPTDGEEVRVPSPVLEDGEEEIALSRERRELPALGGRGCQRLVDHQAETGPEALEPERHVSGVRGRNDDQVVILRGLPDRVGPIHDPRVREPIPSARLTVRVARDDRREGKRRRRRDQRRVEHFAAQAVADQGHSDRVAHLTHGTPQSSPGGTSGEAR